MGHTLSLLVADDGQGIQASLTENVKYSELTEPEALDLCIRDSVTDGKGMGFGLYTTSLLAKDAGLRFANRTNAAEQYNELFLKDNELEELW